MPSISIPTAAAVGTAAASAGTATAAVAGTAAVGTAATAGLGTMGWAAIGAGVLSAAAGAYGAISSSQAQANAAKYNATVSEQNAAISAENAKIAEQSGQAQAGIQEQKTKNAIGAAIAGESASGVDINSGSFSDVRSSQRELGELDAATIRSSAAREAYGYKVQSTSEKASATLSDFEAKNAKEAGKIGAASTFLGGMSSAGNNYASFKLAGGFSG